MSVSKGNMKLGKITNVSLPPVKSCGNSKHCKKNCYSLKAYKQYPNVRMSWDSNMLMALNNKDDYFSMVRKALKTKPRFFRWHVSGDILDQEYLDGMIAIAKGHPEINFLAFTKMFQFNYAKAPENLTIVFSMWPGMKKPRLKKGVTGFAWFQDGTEKRVPKDALECPGLCDQCGMCFQMSKVISKNVVFLKH